jgi:hypothetical protein
MSRPVIIVRRGHLPETIATVIALLRDGRAELARRGIVFYQRRGRLRVVRTLDNGERIDRRCRAATFYEIVSSLADFRSIDGRPVWPPRVFGHVRSLLHLSEWCGADPGNLPPVPRPWLVPPLPPDPVCNSPGGAA